MSEIAKTENHADKLTQAQEQEKTNDEKYLIFSIMGKQFSFQAQFIGEVVLFDTVFPLPLLPDYVPGIINRYSIPYALFDIGLLLFKTPSSRSKVLVLKDEIDRIAFLIDDVIDIADIPVKELLNVERGAKSDDISEAVSASFNWNGSDVFVLAIHRILAQVINEIA
jgi:purine-binding chemotaxis protein CheW